ncbi:hypothetical protein predicted by Glimmer/Critica [Bartonella tribocorum CIP 105476]|uniref:Uncharacterized protein n=1 Tax=Bartonella tribocorum (strain DSM 28219 / CCUG 45778 / CIP 105476 / IBS 506) TaxID=382640 RepID=A9IXS5_BART1|nr:hypothetical protein predicted by Glimmer/Critica [Bartonella tribocorum CIP 105476]
MLKIMPSNSPTQRQFFELGVAMEATERPELALKASLLTSKILSPHSTL